jgi:iron complex outermembrane receptor protein
MSKLLRTSLLACAAGAVLLPGAASAQVEEIVVTARRVEERLQDVPIAISALGAKELEDRQITAFTDLKTSIPNLNMQTQFGQPGTPQITIRGNASGLLSFPVDGGNALYIDGIYLGRSVGAAFGVADLERVEVLRGPQGTLFGRNATGGAVNFITKSPSGMLGVNAEASFANFSEKRFKASLDTPSFGGLAAKITFVHRDHDGYVKNSAAGRSFTLGHYGTVRSVKTLGEMDENSILGALRYTGLDGRLTADYKFDHTNQDLSQLAVQALGFDLPAQALASGLAAGQAARGGSVPVSGQRLGTLPLDFNTAGKTKVTGHALTLAFDVNDHLTLKNILSYRKLSQFSGGNDIDGGAWVDPFTASGSPFCLICSVADRKQNQWTEEFQALGKFDSFDYVVGYFHYREKGNVDNATFIFKNFPGGSSGPITAADYVNGELDRVKNTARAFYGHLTAHLLESVDVAGGVRHSKDDRHVTDFAPAAGFPNPYVANASFDSLDWDISVTYKVQPDINVYGKIATGYLSGGILKSVAFLPEEVTSYEVGLKSDWLERRVRLNAALFYVEQKNNQGATFVPGIGTTIANGATSKQRGLEVEAWVTPVAGLTLSGSIGLNDEVAPPPTTAVRAAVPDTNINLGAQYEFAALANGAVASARLDASYTSKYSGFTQPLADAALEQALRQGGKWDLSARIGLSEFPLGPTTGRVSLWSRNLLNNKQIEFTRSLGLVIVGSFQVPRTYGIDLGIKF